MASISADKRGNRRIQFTDGAKHRQTIRLGRVSLKVATAIKFRVEQLLTAKRMMVEPDAATAVWVRGLDADFAGRLAAVDLIEMPADEDETQLGPFVKSYIESRIDVKPDTKVVWSHTHRNLTKCFGARKRLKDITEGDADEFKMHLISEGLSSTTVHKRLQVARMFFRAAKRKKLCQSNPFDDVRSVAVIDKSRQVFVPRETIDRILDEYNPEWRLIVTLSRYAGLRCPSEVLSLRWEDLNFQTRPDGHHVAQD